MYNKRGSFSFDAILHFLPCECPGQYTTYVDIDQGIREVKNVKLNKIKK